ncbi:MAG: hypothetical protein AAFN12_01810 [Cyanobacteria bacterium J06560_2]
MQINVPLLEQLIQIKATVKRQFPKQNSNWPDAIWIAYWNSAAKLKNGGYYCTPTNSLAFAMTGTDGQHFSFLVQNSSVNEASPIVLTAPDNYEGQTNVVIAKDLHTFARLALRYGCFELTELAYAPKTAIHAFTTAGASKQAIDESEQLRQKVRAFVAKDLDLPPYYYTVEEFKALQAKYMPLLQMPKEYSQ